ncbi:MAG: hypothetical protein AB3N11_11420, partial [Arenibacterium sp.]
LGAEFSRSELQRGEKGLFIEAALELSGSHDGHTREEIQLFTDTAIKQEHLEKNSGSRSEYCRVAVKGHQYVDALGISLNKSEQIFVAMWFSEKVSEFYSEAVKPAIEAAGYTAMRIDDHQHNDKIDDQIIAEIRKSKALICDLTCGLAKPVGSWGKSKEVGAPRGGVFYEAGFAHGLGLPVIWTVDNDIAEIENVSHFDVRQYNQIRWTSDLEDAKQRLQLRIEATLGRGNAK